MKNSIILFLLILFSNLSGQVFFTESFETVVGTGGSGGDCSCVSTTVDAIDGQNDHFARVRDIDITHSFTADYTGEVNLAGVVGEGSAHYWASEDNDDPQVGGSGNQELCITLTTGITGKTDLQFSALLGANSVSFAYEPDNNMAVSYRIDGTGSFNEILDFREDANQQLSLDTSGDNVGNASVVLSAVFQSVTAVIPGTGNSIEIQICMNSNSSSEEFAIDYIQLAEVEVLPIQLKNFELTLTPSKKVKVEWITAMEINNKGFRVERSKDAKHWTTLSFIEGFTHSNEDRYYEFIDESVSNRLYYYRLAQVDFDGSIKLLDIHSIWVNDNRKEEIILFPNPVQDELYINLINQAGQLMIYNVQGQLVLTKRLDPNALFVNTSAWPVGQYLVKFLLDSEDEITRLIIKQP